MTDGGKGKVGQGREGHQGWRGMACVRVQRGNRAWCLQKMIAVYLTKEEVVSQRVT